jgi:hypothetical protein
VTEGTGEDSSPKIEAGTILEAATRTLSSVLFSVIPALLLTARAAALSLSSSATAIDGAEMTILIFPTTFENY